MITSQDFLGAEVRDVNYAVKTTGLTVVNSGSDNERVDADDTFTIGGQPVSLDQAIAFLNHSDRLSPVEFQRRMAVHATKRLSRGASLFGGGGILGVSGLAALGASPAIGALLIASAGAAIWAGAKLTLPMR